MGRYELQILDSYRADTYTDGQAGGHLRTVSAALQRLETTRPVADLRRRVPPSAVRQRRQPARARRASRSSTTASSSRTTKKSWARPTGSSGSPTRGTRTAPRSSCRTTAIPCASGISGWSTCPNDPRPQPRDLARPQPIALRAGSASRVRGPVRRQARCRPHPTLDNQPQ